MSGGGAMGSKLKDLQAKLESAKEVRVGFLENSTYPDGKKTAMIAAIQEFGAPARNIPPRPFFRRMIADKKPTWPKAVADLMRTHGYDAEKVLGLVGQGIKGQLQASIRDLVDPPLSPKTIKRKGFDKPLVDTGHMLNSVDYEVIT